MTAIALQFPTEGIKTTCEHTWNSVGAAWLRDSEVSSYVGVKVGSRNIRSSVL